MALTRKSLRIAGEDPLDNDIDNPYHAYIPDPRHRQLVEILVAVGASHEAICRELVRLGAPCASTNTLKKAFPDELAHGKERRILGYAVKVHAIAMGDGAGSLAAARFLLGTLGGQQWRLPKDEGGDEQPGVPLNGNGNGGNVHIVIPDNGRGYPNGAKPNLITVTDANSIGEEPEAGSPSNSFDGSPDDGTEKVIA